MVLKQSEIEAALKQKGFRRRAGHHKFFIYFTKEGRKTSIFTKTSHGSKHKDVNSGLVSNMAKQCKLTKQEFEDLVRCPLSRDQYERTLENQNAI